MSIRLMNMVWDMKLTDSQKIVMLSLADQANDEGRCWPSIATISRRCSKTERTVQAAIKQLEDAGHLTRYLRSGSSTLFHLHPRNDCTPANSSPPPMSGGTTPPNGCTPTPPNGCGVTTNRTTNRTTNIGEGRKTKAKRASSLPDDFTPCLTQKAQEIVASWPQGMFERELDKFRDHHTAKGSTFKDWQAAFRTWISNADQWSNRNGNGNRRNGSASGLFDACTE